MTTLTLLITEGFADWEAAPLSATLRGWYGGTIIWATPDGAPVTSAGGLRVTPDCALAETLEADGLIVIGGPIWRRPEAPEIAEALQSAAFEGHVVAGICDGTRPLAAAGLLDRVAHTSNDADTLDLAGYGGAARYLASARAVRDGRIVTAPGTAPASFMAEVLAALGLADDNLAYYLGLLAAEHRPAPARQVA